jgi:hypothetical protein
MEININSGQIEIINEVSKVYLYTHNTADSLVKDVYDVLALKLRWDDPDYLTKMLFCKMVPAESWTNDKGFGIGSLLYADVNLLITLDTIKQMITIQSATDKHFKQHMSFSEFLNDYTNTAEI